MKSFEIFPLQRSEIHIKFRASSKISGSVGQSETWLFLAWPNNTLDVCPYVMVSVTDFSLHSMFVFLRSLFKFQQSLTLFSSHLCGKSDFSFWSPVRIFQVCLVHCVFSFLNSKKCLQITSESVVLEYCNSGKIS